MLIFDIFVHHPFSLECHGTLETHALVAFFFLQEPISMFFYTEALGESGCGVLELGVVVWS